LDERLAEHARTLAEVASGQTDEVRCWSRTARQHHGGISPPRRFSSWTQQGAGGSFNHDRVTAHFLNNDSAVGLPAHRLRSGNRNSWPARTVWTD
jgi:hypothetical protein